jgi:hypothetical protein
MSYWTFKHKPGKNGGADSIEYVERAVKLNSGIMQYEYDHEDSKAQVSRTWNAALKVKPDDYIFLMGNFIIYAIGKVISPRKKADIILNARNVIHKNSHEMYSSNEGYTGCIHFEDSPAFYEDLNGEDCDGEFWGQRIDVESWQYFNLQGINADNSWFVYGDTQQIIREVKEDSAIFIINKLKTIFMGNEIQLLLTNRNLILTGAPGTGKTFLAKKLALKMLFRKDSEDLLSEIEKEEYEIRHKFVQFHPSYDYTDFVEGLRPVKKGNDLGFILKNGIFKQFCKNAKKALDEDKSKPKDDKRKFVFIIDEINRAEISKVFGELFFSIDPGYRGMKGKVQTQYANMQENIEIEEELRTVFDEKLGRGWFYVPENVYIIGTMNDIDRSVESMDFAMRRRFAWMEINAKESQRIIDSPTLIEKLNGKINIQILKNRMNNLNNAIVAKELGLSTAYQIGAAYFTKLELYINEISPFEHLWDNHLNVLLSEYLRGTPKASDILISLKAAYNNEK